MAEAKGFRMPWAAISILILGSFMAYLDSSIVNVAIPTLRSAFAVGADEVEWVITAYLLVCGVAVPVSGYLIDRFGSKFMYIFCLGVFTLGSGLCSIAWSNSALVFFRVIQAMGGGMMIPVSMSMIRIMVPRSEMGMALGVWGLSAMGGPALGPTLGGYLVVNFGWPWIFTINIPIGLTTIFLSMFLLEETPRGKGLRFDLPGFLLISSAAFTLLLALSKGQEKGWNSLFIVDLLIYSVFGLVLFIIWEWKNPQPLIDLRLLKNRTYFVSLMAVSLSNIAMYSVIYLIPIYVQSVRGLTPLQSGMLTMPSAIATALMMPVSGRLVDRFGAMPLCIVGFAAAGYYSYQLHTLSYSCDLNELRWMLVKRSLGLGLAMMPMSTVGMKTIPRYLASRASALNNLLRQISGSFGIALATYVMMQRQAYHEVRLGDTLTWSSYAALDAIARLKAVMVTQLGVPPAQALFAAKAALGSILAREAAIAGIDDAMLLAASIFFMIIPLGLFMGKKAVSAEARLQAKRFKPPAYLSEEWVRRLQR
ncbi:MAG: DHA2 family efflux MFS transporter permease subunit [Firmicutes bacterium]|nr:DHA2 family efflux MFS transporter permease subunit [Bacillota bacterium]